MKVFDLFCGIGGFSQGAHNSGLEVIWSGDMNPLAVQWHRNNFPQVPCFVSDHHEENWDLLPDPDGVVGSFCCQGFSESRGKDQPWHEISRQTAWAPMNLLEKKRPQWMLLENVPGFKKWPKRGEWEKRATDLGYHVSYHQWCASESGVAQNRVRLWIAITKVPSVILRPWGTNPRPISEVLKWDEYKWQPLAKKVQATRNRVANARAQGFGERFIAPYYKSGSGLTGRSLDRPIGTLTTKARWSLIKGDQIRMLHQEEAREAMSFPDTFLLPPTAKEANHLLGNAVCPLQGQNAIEELLRYVR